MIRDQIQHTGLNVTFNTTEDCNLRCRYCYETCKTRRGLDFDHARKFIDRLIDDPDPVGAAGTDEEKRVETFVRAGLVADFIGGDSLMDPGLVDRILSYLVMRLYSSDSPNARAWRGHWRANLSSNGTLFSRPDVRAFCEKWRENLSLGVSIDGCPALHDMNRIFPDGSGSMDSILANWEWYKRNFPFNALSTKSTLSRASIPYLYESLVWMHETLGLKYIHQNFIMEDTGCTDSDYAELDRQMEKCVRYTLDHCDEMCWSMIGRHYADHHAVREDDKNSPRCGSGNMPTLSVDGRIYPCFRWLPHTQNGKEVFAAGTAEKGLVNKDAFRAVRNGAKRGVCTKDEKCLACEYESACSYCIGGCYAEHGDFIRTTHICEITKIQCRWAKVYWNEYNLKKGLPLEYGGEYRLEENK